MLNGNGGGKPPLLLLPAIQHSGSQFVRYDLLKDYEKINLSNEPSGPTVFFSHLSEEFQVDRFKTLIKSYPAIVPLRHPRRVFKSWEERGKKLYQCMQEWEFIIKNIVPYNPYYIPIDSSDRDYYLGKIREDLNIGHDLDWRPRGTVRGTMYIEPEAIKLPDMTEDYLKSIEWFTNRFWRESVTETEVVKGVLFKNISAKRIEAYGYRWQPDGQEGDVTEVTEPSLIEKFRKYQALEAIEFITENAPVEAGVVSHETLKSQAIAAGMRVDGRWSGARLEKEVEAYLGGINGD